MPRIPSFNSIHPTFKVSPAPRLTATHSQFGYKSPSGLTDMAGVSKPYGVIPPIGAKLDKSFSYLKPVGVELQTLAAHPTMGTKVNTEAQRALEEGMPWSAPLHDAVKQVKRPISVATGRQWGITSHLLHNEGVVDHLARVFKYDPARATEWINLPHVREYAENNRIGTRPDLSFHTEGYDNPQHDQIAAAIRTSQHHDPEKTLGAYSNIAKQHLGIEKMSAKDRRGGIVNNWVKPIARAAVGRAAGAAATALLFERD